MKFRKKRMGTGDRRIPMRLGGNPEELGGIALYLVSEASNHVTGQTLVIDGGWLAY
jgi:NAD(P)-dependent dehydrogenase (short-subunit alcohol dehydrogenase family)